MTERPTHTTDTVHEVGDDSARNVLINNLRTSLISVKIRSAEDYNDRTRHFLQQCVDLMPLTDQQLIDTHLDDIEQLEKKLEDTQSPFQRFLLVMKYKRVSRKTYLIVKKASNRVINNQIKGRIRAATALQEPPPSLPPIPSLSEIDDAAFNNLERAEMVTMQSRTTGDPLVLMNLHRSDQRMHQYVAALRPLPPGDRMSDGEEDPGAADIGSIRSANEYFGPSSDAGALD